MADAGLTNGAFYAHFAPKDDLVAHVVPHELRTLADRCDTLRPGREGLEDFVRGYLSPEHRDRPGTGCPSAALLDEIGRSADGTKQAYTEGATAIMEEIAARLATADPQAARGRAIGRFTMMVVTLQLSRALADRAFTDDVSSGESRTLARSSTETHYRAATRAAVRGRPPASGARRHRAEPGCEDASGRPPMSTPGQMRRPPAPDTHYRSRKSRASATNCSWNWKMPPWPASG